MSILASNLRPGRIYSFEYASDVDMVNTRDFGQGKQENPMSGDFVQVVRMVTGQAAGKQTYENIMRKLKGDDWEKSDRKDWATVDPENDCILVHNKTQERYLRLIPRGVQRETYYVNNIEATPAQVEVIRQFKKNRSEEKPVYMRFKVDNIVNLTDDGDEDERP